LHILFWEERLTLDVTTHALYISGKSASRFLKEMKTCGKSLWHDFDCSKLLEMMIEGKRHFNIKLFHYDFACAVGETPILIIKVLK
jgi:hypothetical protein